MLIMNCNSNKKYRSKAQSPPAERRLLRLHFIGDFAENGVCFRFGTDFFTTKIGYHTYKFTGIKDGNYLIK